MKYPHQEMSMSSYKEEGKLVMSTKDILKVVLKKVGDSIEKEYKSNPEKALTMMNMIGSLIRHKVSDKGQERGKLFLKFDNTIGEDTVEEARNYRKEYDNYHSRPDQKLRRAARNTARASLKDVPEDKDVHHKDNNPLNNDKSNLSVVTQKYNRSEPRKRERDAKLKEWADAVEQQDEAYSADRNKKTKETLKKHDKRMIKIARDAIKKLPDRKEDTQEDMGTVTGPHIAGTGDDSSTVLVRKKKKIMKRIRDTVDYNNKGKNV